MLRSRRGLGAPGPSDRGVARGGECTHSWSPDVGQQIPYGGSTDFEFLGSDLDPDGG